jgi:hypothetical protein
VAESHPFRLCASLSCRSPRFGIGSWVGVFWFAFLEFRAEGSDARELAGVLVSFEYDQLRLLVYQFGQRGGKTCIMKTGPQLVRPKPNRTEPTRTDPNRRHTLTIRSPYPHASRRHARRKAAFVGHKQATHETTSIAATTVCAKTSDPPDSSDRAATSLNVLHETQAERRQKPASSDKRLRDRACTGLSYPEAASVAA